jgi:hypothetical protein
MPKPASKRSRGALGVALVLLCTGTAQGQTVSAPAAAQEAGSRSRSAAPLLASFSVW